MGRFAGKVSYHVTRLLVSKYIPKPTILRTEVYKWSVTDEAAQFKALYRDFMLALLL
jgi:hypothetical protein